MFTRARKVQGPSEQRTPGDLPRRPPLPPPPPPPPPQPTWAGVRQVPPPPAPPAPHPRPPAPPAPRPRPPRPRQPRARAPSTCACVSTQHGTPETILNQ
ncbi:hypothetical protein JYU34_007882 [Plutella xylostella]|uniref:Uncharacterized protein n=1 Tax=Plutella xylostella TaxID=51655 RepID=A0ABQ7QRJ9_PLUXY|nr:hypothetical protein JYU34_007882 [Plutella xylostella]